MFQLNIFIVLNRRRGSMLHLQHELFVPVMFCNLNYLMLIVSKLDINPLKYIWNSKCTQTKFQVEF